MRPVTGRSCVLTKADLVCQLLSIAANTRFHTHVEPDDPASRCRYASHMLIQEEHEQAKKVASSLRGGHAPNDGDRSEKIGKEASAELGPASVRSLRERVVATVEEHDDAVYMRVPSFPTLYHRSHHAHPGSLHRSQCLKS